MAARPLSLTFLGTCSGGGPLMSRNCTATALNLATGRSWLIDCAEATQHKMLQYRNPLPAKIERVFITHMHVDHVFGLIPLMSTIMFSLIYSGHPDAIRLVLYGPAGLRSFVRNNLKATSLQLGGKYEANELLSTGDTPTTNAPEELHDNEAPGRDFYAAADGTWPAFERTHDGWSISAGPLVHRVPCVGYVFNEPPIPRTVSQEYLAQLDAIPLHLLPRGVRHPRHMLGRLQTEGPQKLVDGSVVQPPPSTRGRKVVVLGDTCDASGCAEIAYGADALVHEATNAHVDRDISGLPPIGKSHEDVERTAISRGHSTPRMAGEFARRINAYGLVMNHFSSRFRGVPAQSHTYVAQERADIMRQIRAQAMQAFGSRNVIAAEDGFVLDLPIPEEEAASEPPATVTNVEETIVQEVEVVVDDTSVVSAEAHTVHVDVDASS
ncbi:hypothetical protein EXIGLDRAFT_761472 [Exidia glandulosa HHB12029]|uniref:Uncharacterized protein n=1 Tax=Exidia glandulosa HHB12029 TaxID=1314781 RepID=A0A165NF60_EXIGL|nr:hypothetical protein EXIGLDRAFT_761472 [Exidia glandulosa HHB12029]